MWRGEKKLKHLIVISSPKFFIYSSNYFVKLLVCIAIILVVAIKSPVINKAYAQGISPIMHCLGNCSSGGNATTAKAMPSGTSNQIIKTNSVTEMRILPQGKSEISNSSILTKRKSLWGGQRLHEGTTGKGIA